MRIAKTSLLAKRTNPKFVACSPVRLDIVGSAKNLIGGYIPLFIVKFLK
jgi:hypothetical protein